MKTVYVVRHGESIGNQGPIRDEAASPLTDTGRKQAAILADRCARFPLEIIISSPLNRAQETAEIIADTIKKPLEISQLFEEWRRPKEQLGELKNDPLAVESERIIRANFSRETFRFSDEENFADLKNRALLALGFLEKRPEKNILVVTHEFFLRILAASTIFGEQLTGYECERCIRTLHITNAGMSVFGFDPERNNSPWWIWVWNDHSHLD